MCERTVIASEKRWKSLSAEIESLYARLIVTEAQVVEQAAEIERLRRGNARMRSDLGISTDTIHEPAWRAQIATAEERDGGYKADWIGEAKTFKELAARVRDVAGCLHACVEHAESHPTKPERPSPRGEAEIGVRR